MRKLVISSVCVAMLGLVGCTKAQETQVVNLISPVAACVADVALATSGTEDPVVIATTCATAVSDVYLVVKELLGNDPAAKMADAGSKVGASATDQANHDRLVRIMERAEVIINSQPDAGK